MTVSSMQKDEVNEGKGSLGCVWILQMGQVFPPSIQLNSNESCDLKMRTEELSLS